MIDAAAWQAFGGVAAVTVLLAGFALALQRLGILRPGRPGGAVAFAARLEAVEREQVRLAAALGALPRASELRRLAGSAAETRGDVKAIRAALDGLRAMVSGLGGQVAALNRHLLERR